MNRAQATWLPDERRLHLHHGPIDMIVDALGPGREAGLNRAVTRFETLLDELVAELPRLRAPDGPLLQGETARAMANAVAPFAPTFVTPMAAVAGAGADTILKTICAEPGIDKAYVNNGGDVAFHLAPGQTMAAAIATDPPGRAEIRQPDPVRGIATSGWRGRSHSLGIADSVTVLARTAAQADVAATLIANHVDIPGHPAIQREPANTLSPDTDLGDLPVTTHVGELNSGEVAQALNRGAGLAQQTLARGLVYGAILVLHGQTRVIGPIP